MKDPKDMYRHESKMPGAREVVADILYTATEMGCEEIKCSGVSFVTSGINIWVGELAEFAPKETAEMLRAIADMVEAQEAKPEFEERRVEAVKQIFAKAALMNEPTKGES